MELGFLNRDRSFAPGGEVRLRSCPLRGSHRWNGWTPRVATRIRAARGDERVADASRTDLEGFSNHVLARNRFLGESSIGFKNQRNGLLQVDPGLFQGRALG